MIAGTWNRSDGWRDNGRQNSMRAYLQTGWRWSDRIETRAGLLWNEVNAQIPGQLTIDAALADPQQAATSNRNFAFARDIDSLRGWVTTTVDLGPWGDLRVGGAATDRALYHPLTSVIDQDTEDFLITGDWRGQVASPAGDLGWTLGARWRDARTDAKTFAGTPDRQALRGRLTANSIQRAGGLSIHGEVRLSPRPDLTLLAGFNQTQTDRDVENLTNPTASDGRSFSGFSPKFGIVWEPLEGVQIFANASGLYEPPSFGQLTQGGFVTFVPIKAQEGLSLEAGLRGTLGGFAIELTAYDATLDNEFIAFQVSPTIPAATFNAGRTIHQGLGAGFRGVLVPDLLGGRLSLASAWTLNRFRFDADPVYGDNTLAGVPSNTLVAELAWDRGPVRIAPSAFIQSGTWVDFANSLKAPGHTLWNLTASWRVNDTLTLSLDGRNLTDARVISMVGTIADARARGANLAIATPGEGRALFASARLSLGARP